MLMVSRFSSVNPQLAYSIMKRALQNLIILLFSCNHYLTSSSSTRPSSTLSFLSSVKLKPILIVHFDARVKLNWRATHTWQQPLQRRWRARGWWSWSRRRRRAFPCPPWSPPWRRACPPPPRCCPSESGRRRRACQPPQKPLPSLKTILGSQI